jgi:hypothetical protein
VLRRDVLEHSSGCARAGEPKRACEERKYIVRLGTFDDLIDTIF